MTTTVGRRGFPRGIWRADERIPDGYALDLQNLEIDVDGKARSRRGAAVERAVAGRNFVHGRRFVTAAGVAQKLIIDDAGNVYDAEPAVPTLTGTIAAAASYDSAQAQDGVYIATCAAPAVFNAAGGAAAVALPQPGALTLIGVAAAGDLPDPPGGAITANSKLLRLPNGQIWLLRDTTGAASPIDVFEPATLTWRAAGSVPAVPTGAGAFVQDIMHWPGGGGAQGRVVAIWMAAAPGTAWFRGAPFPAPVSTTAWADLDPSLPAPTWSVGGRAINNSPGEQMDLNLYMHRGTDFSTPTWSTRPHGILSYRLGDGAVGPPRIYRLTGLNPADATQLMFRTVSQAHRADTAAGVNWNQFTVSDYPGRPGGRIGGVMQTETAGELVWLMGSEGNGAGGNVQVLRQVGVDGVVDPGGGPLLAALGPGTFLNSTALTYGFYVRGDGSTSMRILDTIVGDVLVPLGSGVAAADATYAALAAPVVVVPAGAGVGDGFIYHDHATLEFTRTAIGAVGVNGNYRYVATWANAAGQQSPVTAELAVPNVPPGATVTIGYPALDAGGAARPATVTQVRLYRTLAEPPASGFGLRRTDAAAAIAAHIVGAAHQITSTAHGVTTGTVVTLVGVTGTAAAALNAAHVATFVDANTFSVPVNTTALTAAGGYYTRQVADAATQGVGSPDLATPPPAPGGGVGGGLAGVIAGACFVAYHLNALFWQVGEFVYFSRDGAVETYDPAWRFRTRGGTGDPAAGVTSIPAGLLVFRRRSIFLFVGAPGEPPAIEPTGFLRQVSNSVGCYAPASRAVLFGRCFFVGRDGVYWTDGGEPQKVAVPDAVAALFRRPQTRAAADVDGSRYHVTVGDPAAGDPAAPTRVLVFDAVNGRFEAILTAEAHRTGAFAHLFVAGDQERLNVVCGERLLRIGDPTQPRAAADPMVVTLLVAAGADEDDQRLMRGYARAHLPAGAAVEWDTGERAAPADEPAIALAATAGIETRFFNFSTRATGRRATVTLRVAGDDASASVVDAVLVEIEPRRRRANSV